jgi:hypothetical protein
LNLQKSDYVKEELNTVKSRWYMIEVNRGNSRGPLDLIAKFPIFGANFLHISKISIVLKGVRFISMGKNLH